VGRIRFIFVIIFSGIIPLDYSAAQNTPKDSAFHFELGEEYSEYNRTSPKSAPTPSSRRNSHSSFLRKVLLYIPNRVLDLVDIVRLDVGVGIGYGGVIRPTKYLQAGYREMEPGMLRFGALGRRSPFLIEEVNEEGFGRDFARASKRKVSKVEFGVGLDLGVIGGYGGVCIDSAGDFVLGIFGIDFEDDDLE